MIRKTNLTPLNTAGNLILSAAIIIIGAIFRNSHIAAGHWITLAGMGYYLLTNILPTWKQARRFSLLPPRLKAHVLIVAVMLGLFIRAFFITDASYFIMLVLLAIEYLLLDPPVKK